MKIVPRCRECERHYLRGLYGYRKQMRHCCFASGGQSMTVREYRTSPAWCPRRLSQVPGEKTK